MHGLSSRFIDSLFPARVWHRTGRPEDGDVLRDDLTCLFGLAFDVTMPVGAPLPLAGYWCRRWAIRVDVMTLLLV